MNLLLRAGYGRHMQSETFPASSIHLSQSCRRDDPTDEPLAGVDQLVPEYQVGYTGLNYNVCSSVSSLDRAMTIHCAYQNTLGVLSVFLPRRC